MSCKRVLSVEPFGGASRHDSLRSSGALRSGCRCAPRICGRPRCGHSYRVRGHRRVGGNVKHSVEVMMLLCGARRAEAGLLGGSQPSLRRWVKNAAWPTLTRGDMCLRRHSRGRCRPRAPAPVRESVRERVAHLRERAERTRAGIEARRADSASIDTAWMPSSGMPRAGEACSLPPWPSACSCSWCPTPSSCSPASAWRRRRPARTRGRGPIGRHHWAARQRRRQHQHLVAGQPAGRPGPRRVRPGPDGGARSSVSSGSSTV